MNRPPLEPNNPEGSDGNGITRRRVLFLGSATAACTLLPNSACGQTPPSAAAATDAGGAPAFAKIAFTVNGKTAELEVDTRVTLLDALREGLQLTGTKKGCDHGQCGACTVMVGGKRINSCLSLAVMHDGDEITTIEGLGNPDDLHPMQAAFMKHDGFQCGYCTPGQICSAVATLREIRDGVPSHVSGDLTKAPKLTRAEITERMSGNICRCGAYSNIVDAITEVAGSPS